MNESSKNNENINAAEEVVERQDANLSAPETDCQSDQSGDCHAKAMELLDKLTDYTNKCIAIALSNPEIDPDDSEEVLEIKRELIRSNSAMVESIRQTISRLADIVEKMLSQKKAERQ